MSLPTIAHLLPLLTLRERQIITMVALGLPNKTIARHLKIKVSTVKMHLHNTFLKLQISNRTTLAVVASQLGSPE